MFEVGQVVELIEDIEIVNGDGDAYDWIDQGETGTITEINDSVWVRFVDYGEVGIKPEWIRIIDNA